MRVRIIYVTHNLRVLIMSNLYSVLVELCEKNKITPYRLCKDTGIQPSVMTDLKMGRRHTVKAETAAKLANYFGVSVDYLLGNETKEKAPAESEGISDDDIKFALFNGADGVTDEMYEEVKRFAQFIKDRENR